MNKPSLAKTIFSFACWIVCLLPLATVAALPWSPDNRDGTYKNPIIFADYSDPDAIRVGKDFYMTASSFNCTPGLPILHSRDLVNWQLINYAIQNVPHPRYAEVQPGCGVWAPSIRFHAGKYWIYFPTPDEGIYVTTTTDPAGKWSEPQLVQAGKGLIDPCPFWDDDGQAYLVHAWANSRAGVKSIITIRRMSPDGLKLLDEGKMVFDGHAYHPTIEGPKLYKRNGYYYIFAPAGGVTTGWQTILRSTNIFGPYEDKIVLAQGDTPINGPHQGAWVDTPKGQDWFLHFQDREAFGRVVHLQPMTWQDDWPVMGDNGKPVLNFKKPDITGKFPVTVPPTSTDFSAEKLGLQWQWQANPQTNWLSLAQRKGWLRLFSAPQNAPATNLWLTPNLLLQKLSAPEFTVTTKLDFSKLAVGEKAGLTIFGLDFAYLAVERTEKNFQLVKFSCLNADKRGAENLEEETACEGEVVWLRVAVASDGVCDFSFSYDGNKFSTLGNKFTARVGKWIGAKVGLFSVAPADATATGYADFDYFRY